MKKLPISSVSKRSLLSSLTVTPNGLIWLQMSLYVSNKSTEVILNNLESFKSWGNKISNAINMQCSLSLVGHSARLSFWVILLISLALQAVFSFSAWEKSLATAKN